MDEDTTSAAGRLVVEVVSAAAFESRRIGWAFRATHVQRRVTGKWAGRPPVLPQRVPRRIVRARAQGGTLSTIAEALNDEGCRSPGAGAGIRRR